MVYHSPQRMDSGVRVPGFAFWLPFTWFIIFGKLLNYSLLHFYHCRMRIAEYLPLNLVMRINGVHVCKMLGIPPIA